MGYINACCDVPVLEACSVLIIKCLNFWIPARHLLLRMGLGAAASAGSRHDLQKAWILLSFEQMGFVSL